MPNSNCYVLDFILTYHNPVGTTQIDENKLNATPNIMMRTFELSYLICFYFLLISPFLSSNIPSSPAYGVFMSQLIRYTRAWSSYECFILRAARL